MKEVEILPYYKNTRLWKQALRKWLDTKKDSTEFNSKELELFFYSAYSCADHEAYKKGIQLFQERRADVCCKFYTLTYKALKQYTEGKYAKAQKSAKDAAEFISENKNERLYFFQLYREIRLRNALEKLKSTKTKIKYLEFKYFEISGNILYSTDILGLTKLLKYKKLTLKSEYLNLIAACLNNIYCQIKRFKNDLNKLELYNKENELPSLTQLAQLALRKEDLQAIGFSGIHLIILSKVLALGMHMQASMIVRKLAKEYFIKNREYFYKNHNILYLYSIRACLEEKIPVCLEGFTHPERYQVALEHAKPYIKTNDNKSSTLNIKLEKNDQEYEEYIYDKRVALIGPINTGLENGLEIDEYDIVIRLNTISSKNYPKNIFGTKTSAAYFVRDYFSENQKEIIDNMNHLDFVSFHTVRDDDLLNLIEKNKKLRTTLRYHERINNIFFSGYPNLIQRAAMDIIRFRPKELKIFNANLWIENIQSDFYIYKQVFYPVNLILHDIYSNFTLTKKLYENGYIKADKALTKILNMSQEQYAEKMILTYEYKNLTSQ